MSKEIFNIIGNGINFNNSKYKNEIKILNKASKLI